MMKSTIFFLTLFLISVFARAQSVIISNPKENTVYLGLPNSIDMCIEGAKCKDYTLTTDNGTIAVSETPCSYTIEPSAPGVATISVNSKKNNKTIHKIKFRVKNIPEPIPLLNRQAGGEISKKILDVQLGLIAQIQNIDIDSRILITGFTVTILRNNDCLFTKKCEGQLFTNEVKAAFSSARTNDKIIFSGISYKGAASGGSLRPIEFIVID